MESDLKWLSEVCNNALLKDKAADKKFFPFHANIGSTTDWGRPKEQKPSLVWLNYHQYIWNNLPASDMDFILIDGRFRIACALQAFLRCREDAVYYVHDFNNRPPYHVILDYSEVMESVDTSVVLRRKKDPDYVSLALLLQKHQFDYT